MATREQLQTYARAVPRKSMAPREIKPATQLAYETPHTRQAHAHAVAGRTFVDWKAVARQVGTQRFHRAPRVSVESLGEIVIVRDNGSLTLRSGELNYIRVWDYVRRTYGDEFDFLTFFTDFSVPFSYSFWSAIYFNTQGISPYQLPYDMRGAWNTNRLQGFHFINPGHVNLTGVYLQEFGHQWGSYVYFADSAGSANVYTNLLLDGQPGHWDFFMDDGHSPMNYDFQFTPYMSTHWEQRPDDPSLFEYHAAEGIEYCDLDLYLMGLLPADQAGSVYFIANPMQVAPEAWAGQRIDVTVQMVINAMGPRQAPPGLIENNFRNGWILVTRNLQRGRLTAARLDTIRQDFEFRYYVATRGLGRVFTSLPR